MPCSVRDMRGCMPSRSSGGRPSSLILLFGKRLPKQGRRRSASPPLAVCFVLAVVHGVQWIARGSTTPPRRPRAPVTRAASAARGRSIRSESRSRRGRGRPHEAHGRGHGQPVGRADRTWFAIRRRRSSRRHAARRPGRDDALRRHHHLAAGAHLLAPTTSDGDRALHALLRVPVAVHRVDAHARDERATRCSSSPAGSSSASARSCSSATGGRRSRTPTPRSRRSSPTASATSACSSA